MTSKEEKLTTREIEKLMGANAYKRTHGRIKVYEAITLGDCLKLAEQDGWKPNGELTRRICKTCFGIKVISPS